MNEPSLTLIEPLAKLLSPFQASSSAKEKAKSVSYPSRALFVDLEFPVSLKQHESPKRRLHSVRHQFCELFIYLVC